MNESCANIQFMISDNAVLQYVGVVELFNDIPVAADDETLDLSLRVYHQRLLL